MKLIIALFGLLLLIGAPGLRAEHHYPPPVHDEDGPAPEHFGSPPPGRPPHTSGRRSRHRHGDILFKQFRREVGGLGEEIRENLELIEEQEEKLVALPAGLERDRVREKLAGLRRRQAELRLELARKKVAFTLRALEISEERYQKALAEMEEVRTSIVREYPDLADLPPVE